MNPALKDRDMPCKETHEYVIGIAPPLITFAAWEQPQIFCDEIRASFRSLRT